MNLSNLDKVSAVLKAAKDNPNNDKLQQQSALLNAKLNAHARLLNRILDDA